MSEREFTHEDARELVNLLTDEFHPTGVIILVQRADRMHVMGSAAKKGDEGDGLRAIRDALKEFFRDHGLLVQMPAAAKEESDA